MGENNKLKHFTAHVFLVVNERLCKNKHHSIGYITYNRMSHKKKAVIYLKIHISVQPKKY